MPWYPGYYMMILSDILSNYKNKNLHTKEFTEFVDACDTTSKCGYIASTQFVYTSDKHEHWQTPIETWNRRSGTNKMVGDCDDWARFFTYCLNANDQPALFLAMYDDESGHATCRLDNETVGTFRRVRHSSDDIREIATFWYPRWLRIRVYKQHGPEDGYRLECIKIFRRSLDEVAGIKAGFSRGEAIGDFIEKLAEIDPSAYADLIDELMPDVK